MWIVTHFFFLSNFTPCEKYKGKPDLIFVKRIGEEKVENIQNRKKRGQLIMKMKITMMY